MSAARAKNTASTDEIRKLLKAELDGLDATKFMTTNMDKLVADYVVFMVALIKLTLRPSKKMLEAAAKAAFSKSTEQECERFASAICRGIQYCRKKVASMTSGKKLDPGVKTVCRTLVKAAAASSPSPKKRRKSGRSLKVSSSWASSSVPTSPATKRLIRKQKPSRHRSTSSIQSLKTYPSSFVATPRRSMSSPRSTALAVAEVISSDEDEARGAQCKKPRSREPAGSAGQGVVVYIGEDMRLRRVSAGGHEEEANMSPGPDGFAIATWPDGSTIVSEVPNLTLEKLPSQHRARPRRKQRPKRRQRRRPRPRRKPRPRPRPKLSPKPRGRG